jgi:hypothetical protein
MKKILLYLVFSCLFVNVFSQKKVEEIKIEGAEGTAIGKSLPGVIKQARDKAKVDALKKAGITENINTYTDFYQSETDDEYSELFSSDIFSNIRGAVKDVEIVDTLRSFTKEGFIKVTAVINCTVLKYSTSNDLSFNFKVSGIKQFYNNNAHLKFSIMPSKPGYLKAFLFTKNEAYQLFPNNWEKSILFRKDSTYKFPLEELDYILETTKNSEIHRIVFVYLKKEIPFYGSVKYEEIFDWIFSIPPDQRKVKSNTFTVVNEKVN